MSGQAATATKSVPQEETQHAAAWVTVVWDDPVNLMSYVTYVFREYFNYPQAKAEKLMLQVHHQGKAVVSTGNREAMERDVMAMQNYSLWATMEPA
ncbi:MAG: ATP-dependent Clp protease adapter ClpS [Arachnia propionica]|nr:MAG: ATP-dependent Clp protease adapter ClpS [Arachnia propionica]